MCHFITATLPASADAAALDAIARRHGRQLQPLHSPGVQAQLGADLRYYLTTPGHCDCGTALGARVRRAAPRDEAEEARRLRRKGWSEGKIERALAQRRQQRENDDAAQGSVAGQELETWRAFIAEALSMRNVSSFGLLVHHYHGAIDAEFALQGRETLTLDQATPQRLGELREDVLYLFRR
ncbi:hypothetical protein [Lysobacter silvisoli]|uniref:Uncharacterized protein n=1 Tax=Lysobacter silvisoli TaxID=2293254 RepID=A0A371K036_9GAMM|nr:hypothetical protein [Lysobacter silvisoli]RDZ27254.1 hypothetical protein DX914_13480 [Lysobacter silvisoli]